ncbi:MAG: YebC/PmpR family DNA-binding transcriptional regulator [Firmicutes bacterium]|nr:YebC/PmpR family DNA-binding transcriptional regulator [Bacillota bacterium]
MAGHSKWSNIKHRKAAQDAKRGQAFTKVARQIVMAVKEGGPDPETNFRLRLAIDRARQINMPNDNIERAINRGVGNTDGDNFEEIIYEGYGPHGVAIMMQVLTDNRNRTAGEVRHALSKAGGNLGESGCVSWMFEQKGLIAIEQNTASPVDEDELMMQALEAGAEDIQLEEDVFKILTAPNDFNQVKQALEAEGYQFLVAEVSMVPKNTISISEEAGEQIEKLIDTLEDLDDVQEVYTNYEIE